AHFTKVDILVNNAGVEKNAPFWEVSEKDYDLVLNVNLKGLFFVTQAAVRRWMSARQGGKIINISSVHDELPFPRFAPYCASKGGVVVDAFLRSKTNRRVVRRRRRARNSPALASGLLRRPRDRAKLPGRRHEARRLHDDSAGDLHHASHGDYRRRPRRTGKR